MVLTLLLFLSLAPLQWLALRRRWPLRLWLPVALGRTLAALLPLHVFANRVPSPQGPRLIVANHVSWLDIVVLCSVEPVCFLAKLEVEAWPVVSHFARLQETVFVDRQRRRTIPAANAAMAQRMLAGRPVLLFARPAMARRCANFTARISPPRAIFSPRQAVSRRFACNLSLSAIHRPRRHGLAMRPCFRTSGRSSRASRSGAISCLASRSPTRGEKVARR